MSLESTLNTKQKFNFEFGPRRIVFKLLLLSK
jgi:hypothetical protein